MMPIIAKPPLTRAQRRAALAVAMVVDFIQLPGFLLFFDGVLSPFEDVLDFFTAIILTAICGFKWQFAVAFAAELVPMFDLLPTWTAVVLLLPVEPRSQEAGPRGGASPASLNVEVRVDSHD